jgi:hypothetical protein
MRSLDTSTLCMAGAAIERDDAVAIVDDLSCEAVGNVAFAFMLRWSLEERSDHRIHNLRYLSYVPVQVEPRAGRRQVPGKVSLTATASKAHGVPASAARAKVAARLTELDGLFSP